MGRTHLRALEASPDVQVVSVAEPHETAANVLLETGLSVYPRVSEMLAAGGIDGVLIATPTDQHLAIVDQVAGSGLSILCEKPCGLNAAQAGEAGNIAARRQVLLQVGYWRRFVPGLHEMRRAIATGGLGEIHLTICSQWDENPPAAQFRLHSGGIFVDMGVHEIDQIRWLTGQEVVRVQVTAFPTVEDPEAVGDVDSAQALLTMADGSAALVSLGRFHPGGDLVAAEVYGSRGHMRVDVLLPEQGERVQLEALRFQTEAFARAAQGGAPEGATVEDAVAALTVARQLTEAAGLG